MRKHSPGPLTTIPLTDAVGSTARSTARSRTHVKIREDSDCDCESDSDSEPLQGVVSAPMQFEREGGTGERRWRTTCAWK